MGLPARYESSLSGIGPVGVVQDGRQLGFCQQLARNLRPRGRVDIGDLSPRQENLCDPILPSAAVGAQQPNGLGLRSARSGSPPRQWAGTVLEARSSGHLVKWGRIRPLQSEQVVAEVASHEEQPW